MRALLAILLAAAIASGCAPRTDYSLFESRLPRSILILMPLNETTTVDAPEKLLATITEPVAERGYYVVPIAVADRMFKENGVIGPEEMRQVSRDKLRDIFGVDAVLDITITEWGTSYFVVASSTNVTLRYRLLDLHTGAELWSTTRTASDSSNDGNNGIAGALIGALAHAIEGVSYDKEIGLARALNRDVLMDTGSGLLAGPRWVEDPR